MQPCSHCKLKRSRQGLKPQLLAGGTGGTQLSWQRTGALTLAAGARGVLARIDQRSVFVCVGEGGC